ncbi:uncharacterized protein JCM15063_000789 [Sporobolomyces koalae]|uniref:uncharacterized protein n=1 Tax=Sporobolomyces koalae TaxID=500713 RepID=UPI00316B4522
MAPKRPADAYSSSSFPTDRATVSAGGKRTRYAPPNADQVLQEPQADDLELDLEGTGAPQNSKKKIVTDGYDSDSSGGEDEDGYGGGKRRKDPTSNKNGTGPDDDDDDMFGPDQVERDVGNLEHAAQDRKQAGKEWLEMGDIEGQEFSKRDMQDDPEAEDDDDDEDEEEDYEPVDDHANDDDAPRSRRSKKGMGFQLSSFNMKEELAEGRFSADGSYVANSVDPLANHDSWLTGLSKAQIKQAKESKERMDQKNRERERDEAMRGEEQLTQLRDDCLIGLSGETRPGETVAKALNRLGNRKKRVEQVVSHLASAEPATADDNAEKQFLTASIEAYTNKINRLTHFASTLLSSHGELEIYDQTHEDIVKTLKLEGAVRRDWSPATTSQADQSREQQEDAAWTKHLDHNKASGSTGTSSSTREGRSRVVISRPTTTADGSGAATVAKYWYKWNPAPPGQQDPEEKFGPFEKPQFEEWIRQGYFGDENASRILVRRDGNPEGEFQSWPLVR